MIEIVEQWTDKQLENCLSYNYGILFSAQREDGPLHDIKPMIDTSIYVLNLCKEEFKRRGIYDRCKKIIEEDTDMLVNNYGRISKISKDFFDKLLSDENTRS